MDATYPPAQAAPSAGDLAACWAAVGRSSPLVQCLTNIVAAPLTANLLLAAGAAPAMVDNAHEAGAFARRAGAVLVNLGTPREETVAARREAVGAAASAGVPWILDPIGVGGRSWRTGIAHELLGLGPPAVIRGNASEIIGLAGGEGGRGTDTAHSTEAAIPAAFELAARLGGVVATSGEVDHLTDGHRVVRVPHGHPLMTRVSGVGCALGALVAACAAVTEDHLVAAATGTVALTLAAEQAAESARGPGSFAAGLLDEVAALTPERIAAEVDLR